MRVEDKKLDGNDRPANKTALLVIWQSLVVEPYRYFFQDLMQLTNWRVGLVAPSHSFEGGFRRISCAPFVGRKELPRPDFFQLRVLFVHIQIVLFLGLRSVLGVFFGRQTKQENQVVFAFAEPYSITALWIWLSLKLRLFHRSPAKLTLYTFQNINKSFRWPMSAIQNKMFKEVAAIGVPGPEQREVLKQQGYSGRIIEFPMWFDADKYRVQDLATARRTLCAEFPDLTLPDSDSVTIGYAGALVPQKGILDITACMRANVAKFDKANFWFVGQGPLEDQLNSELTELNQLGAHGHWLGWLPPETIPLYLAACDIVLVPSRTMENWKEQFGRIVVEAQGCGAIVIVSDSGHLPNLSEDPKLIHREGDQDGMAECIFYAVSMLEESDRPRLRSRISKSAGEQYSSRVVGAKLAEDLSSL